MDKDNIELKTAVSRIEEKYGAETKSHFNDFISTALTDNHKLTFDEVLYVGELLVRGIRVNY